MHGLVGKLQEAYLDARKASAAESEPPSVPWDQWDRRWLFARDVPHGVSQITAPSGDGPFQITGCDASGAAVVRVHGPASAFHEAVGAVALDAAAAANAGGFHVAYYGPIFSGQVSGGHPHGGGPNGIPPGPIYKPGLPNG